MLVRMDIRSPGKEKALGRRNLLTNCIAGKNLKAVWATMVRYGVTPKLLLTQTLGRATHCGTHLPSKHSQSHISKESNKLGGGGSTQEVEASGSLGV